MPQRSANVVVSPTLSLAKALIERFRKLKRATIIAKDVSWLWRTAYNCAIQGCSDWENQEDAVATLFDVAREVGV